jgi:hypothetical protein
MLFGGFAPAEPKQNEIAVAVNAKSDFFKNIPRFDAMVRFSSDFTHGKGRACSLPLLMVYLHYTFFWACSDIVFRIEGGNEGQKNTVEQATVQQI